VSCIVGRNLPAEWDGATGTETVSDISVVVLSDQAGSDGRGGPPSELISKVRKVLDRARLIGTRVHVLGPRSVNFGLRVTLAIHRNSRAETVQKDALEALNRFFDPMEGGPAGGGWPFGRDVYLSEIYQLLAGVDGVDDVREIVVTPHEQKRVVRNRLQEVEAIGLGPGELVAVQVSLGNIIIEPAEKYANRN
jgi:phage-related baseplate assembly protein